MACSFLFQAEDGIRDLVRSRGLGDVYKRQAQEGPEQPWSEELGGGTLAAASMTSSRAVRGGVAVSYTHLTLPTSDLV